MLGYRSKKHVLINSIIVIFSFLLLLLVIVLTLNPFFNKAIAVSPSFGLQQMINKNHNWVQTYGSSDAHLSLVILTY